MFAVYRLRWSQVLSFLALYEFTTKAQCILIGTKPFPRQMNNSLSVELKYHQGTCVKSICCFLTDFIDFSTLLCCYFYKVSRIYYQKKLVAKSPNAGHISWKGCVIKFLESCIPIIVNLCSSNSSNVPFTFTNHLVKKEKASGSAKIENQFENYFTFPTFPPPTKQKASLCVLKRFCFVVLKKLEGRISNSIFICISRRRLSIWTREILDSRENWISIERNTKQCSNEAKLRPKNEQHKRAKDSCLWRTGI